MWRLPRISSPGDFAKVLSTTRALPLTEARKLLTNKEKMVPERGIEPPTY